MRCESSTTVLLERAGGGAESAWQEIVRRYSPLVLSVCRRCGVVGTDVDDVGGNVWMRLVLNLTKIREPEALSGWLATTARRECMALLRSRLREIPTEREIIDRAEPGADASLLFEERRSTVRGEVARLPKRDRELVSMLMSDPAPSYAEISSRLGVPVGTIGPTRQRCLDKLRRTTAIAALLDEGHSRSA